MPRKRSTAASTLAAAAAHRARMLEAPVEEEVEAQPVRRPAAKAAPKRRARAPANPADPPKQRRKPAPKRRASPDAEPRRRAPVPAASEPYAVRVARRGGKAEPRPLERSGAMAFPLAPHLGPPDFLDAIAAAEWRRIAVLQGRFAERGLSWISEVDLAAVTAYCAGWSVWCRAARALMEAADFTTTDDKGREIPRPELRIEREARTALLMVAKELGLTSMVRARIQAQMYSGAGADDDDGLLA